MSEKKILIAVADAALREEYRRVLGEHWQATAAASGTNALEEASKQEFDVLIADLDLPDFKGAETLNEIHVKHPNVILLVLAPDADKEKLLKDGLGAHQFITKPCDASALKGTIERAMALDRWVANNRLRELIARIRTFPTVPSVYLEITAALKSPNASTEEVGAIIARDMAMMTKLLQVLNSACFGLPRKITNPAEAVGILGFESVKSMVMTIKLMNQYDKIKPVYFSIDKLWRHSTEVGRTAKFLAALHTDDPAISETAFTAGLVHDLGKIILATNFDEQYQGAQSLAKRQQLPLHEVEREIFGAGHGEIGAYLLGLWGMPLDLIEVAALHHHPSRSSNKSFSPLTAVHVANVFEHEATPDADAGIQATFDKEYLAEAGVLDKLESWRKAIEKNEGRKTAPKAKAGARAKAPVIDAGEGKPSLRVTAVPLPKPVHKTAASAADSKPATEYAWFFTRKQWISIAVGGAFALLALSWYVTATLTRQSPKLDGQQPVVARARETDASEMPAANTGNAPEGKKEPLAIPAPAAMGKPAPPLPSDLRLQGIIFSATHPCAILNGKSVQPGDSIGGALVTEITSSNVVLEYKGKRKLLQLK